MLSIGVSRISGSGHNFRIEENYSPRNLLFGRIDTAPSHTRCFQEDLLGLSCIRAHRVLLCEGIVGRKTFLYMDWLSTSIEFLRGSSHLHAQQDDAFHLYKVSGDIHVNLHMLVDLKALRTNRPHSLPPLPSACPARHPSRSHHHPPSHPSPSRCPLPQRPHRSDPGLLT